MRPLAAIVLAAGKSTRMRSELPKVLHAIHDRPMLAYVLDACFAVGVPEIHVVVGHGKQQVIDRFGDDRRLKWIEQSEQLGTGHAVMMAEPALRDFDGDVLIIAGDMPLVQARTLSDLVALHRRVGSMVSLATAELDDPDGYGRVIRDGGGRLQGIVEHRNCTPEQLRIREVNISYYCFDSVRLFDALRRISPDAGKGEYYITDVVHLLVADRRPAAILPGVAPDDALGINSPEDLERVARCMNRRLARSRS